MENEEEEQQGFYSLEKIIISFFFLYKNLCNS